MSGHYDDTSLLSVSFASGNRLVLAGEFDMAGVALWNSVCATAVTDSGDRRVDLTELTFIDAAGMGALVRMNNTLAASGHRITVLRPAQHIRRAFTAAGLEHLMPR